MKKTLWIIGIVLALILSINFIFSIIEFKKFGYEILKNNNKSYDYLFKNECLRNIDFVEVIGNQKEQIYFYKYKNETNLILWNIPGLKDVYLHDIKFFATNDFESIEFNPVRYTETDIFKITSKSENLKFSQLTAYTNEKFQVFNRFQNDSIWYLNINSKGIALGNLSEYKLKIGSSINHIYNFAFVKSETGFQIIVLSSKNDSELREDLLLKLLRNQTSNSPTH